MSALPPSAPGSGSASPSSSSPPHEPPSATGVLAVIAALTRNRAIGRDNGLLWHEPADQRHFRQVTMGCPVIMGRRTWDSLPARFRPLPGRRNLVVTRNPAWRAEGAEPMPSLAAALAACADAPKRFVIGGGQLYAEALPLADELELTEIDVELPGDTHFPDLPPGRFAEVSRTSHFTGDGTAYHFVRYRRIG